MHNLKNTLRILLLSMCGAMLARAQAGPDTITFINGEKLVGHFVRSDASSVTFKSDMLGDLTIDWKKVQELDTAAKVAVIRKGVRLSKKQDTSSVPQGTLVAKDQQLQVTPAPNAPPQSVPIADSAVVIDQPSFQTAMTRTPGFFSDWTGTVTAGATLVEATQNNRSFNGEIALVRAEPTEDWLNPSNKTLFNFSATYGELSEPKTPTIKTSIYHAAVERDQYIRDDVFAFAQADFDHNYSQGLVIQQTYNGGIGWTVIKSGVQALDLKASMSYIRQEFYTAPTLNLIGSVFAENYTRKLPHGATLDQRASITAAWNNTNAYSALFAALVSVPVYKNLSGSTGIVESYLNNPPPGFNKNSFTFTLGLTYALK